MTDAFVFVCGCGSGNKTGGEGGGGIGVGLATNSALTKLDLYSECGVVCVA